MLIKYNETGEIVTSWKYNKGNNVFEIFSNDKEKISEYDPVLVFLYGAGAFSRAAKRSGVCVPYGGAACRDSRRQPGGNAARNLRQRLSAVPHHDNLIKKRSSVKNVAQNFVFSV